MDRLSDHTAAFREASLYGYLSSTSMVTAEDVRRYLEFGGDVNYQGTYKCTPFHVYLRLPGEKSVEVIDLLLDAGADLNSRDICGFTPLHMYICYADVEPDILRHLLERGARADAIGNGMTTDALFAYLNTHGIDDAATPEVVELLIRAGANVNARGEADKTPLHVHSASFTVNPEVTRLLLDAGADAEALDEFGMTPADVLVKSVGANVETLRLLLAASEGIATRRDVRGRTALHHHADSFRANADIVRELLRAGCDPAATDMLDNTPLHSLATFCSCKHSVLDQLVAHGADINAMNVYGHTPLYYAAIYNPEACPRLIAAGADVSARTPDDRTPMTGMIMRKNVRALTAALNTCPPLDAICASLDGARPGSASDVTRLCVREVVLRGGARRLSAPMRHMHADFIAQCEAEVATMAAVRLGAPETSLLALARRRAPQPVLLQPRVHRLLCRFGVYRDLLARLFREYRRKTRLVEQVARRVCPCSLPPEVVVRVLSHVPADDLAATLRCQAHDASSHN
ncbi:Ank protein [Bovine papular stomatitis virus]